MATPVSKITGIATGDVLADGSIPFTGAVRFPNGTNAAPSVNLGGNGGFYYSAAGPAVSNGGYNILLGGFYTQLPAWGILGWSSNNTDGTSGYPDAGIVRDGSGILALRIGTNAQALRVYNTYTDASNYERGFMRWASNVLEIGAEAAGTGTARAMKLLRLKGTTGAGSAALGANSPATTNTAPYTWVEITSSDGSTCYIPAFK